MQALAFENADGQVNNDHIRKMFIKKRQKSQREVIEQRKLERNLMDPGREGWMMTSYNKYQVIAISGTSSINVMDLSRDG